MGIKITIPAPSDASGTGLGKFSPFTNPRNSLYAAWALGTGYPGGNPLTDLSSNGRDLTLALGSVGTDYLSGNASNYLDWPFTTADLGAVNDEFTIVCLSRILDANGGALASSGAGLPSASLTIPADANVAAANRDASLTATGQVGSVNKVGGVTVTNGGTGYADTFPVTFSGGTGSGVTATAFAELGVIQRIYVTQPGASYTAGSPPNVDLSLGGGSGGAATAVLGRAPDAATRWKMRAGIWTKTSGKAYVSWGDPSTNPPVTNTASKATGTLGSSGTVHIGYLNHATTLNGQVEIMHMACYTRALTDLELASVQRNLANIYGPYGELDWS